MQGKKKGFSLIELLIVVAIILIIASIAIPSLLAARRQTNETAVVGAVRAINTAQISYDSA
jgi:type IV pilus assembly protein PilA